MRRLLMVTPRYAPCGGADSRRAEQLVPRLAALGWEAEILAAHCEGEGSSPTAPVHRIARPAFTIPGFRTPGMRSLRAFDRLATRLHARSPFDAVLFTNTDFATWRLGPRWSERWRVPFILDWQDPWFTTYYDAHPTVVPPGGRVKFALANALARRWEARVAPEAAGHVLVSAAYDAMLVSRYPSVAARPREVIPISFEPVSRTAEALAWRPDGCGSRYWAAVGRGGPDMAAAAHSLFKELSAARRAARDRLDGLQLWFIGTDYAPAARARATIAPLAVRYGLGDCVFEIPQRIPEAAARSFQRDAEALVVLGSDDPGYMPSKLFGDLASGKPIVAAFAVESTARGIANTMPGVVDVSTPAGDGSLLLGALDQWAPRTRYVRDVAAFGPDAMASRVSSLLDATVSAWNAQRRTRSPDATERKGTVA